MHGAFWAGQRKVILSLTVRPGQPAGGQQEQRKDEPGVQQPRVSKPPPKAGQEGRFPRREIPGGV